MKKLEMETLFVLIFSVQQQLLLIVIVGKLIEIEFKVLIK